jgi:hypothetical protein
MFCPSNEVNTVWSVVARHTAEGDLGIAAKVAPDANDGNARLICVYTENFNDMEDVTRVIRKMKDLGLVSSRERPIYYKCGKPCYQIMQCHWSVAELRSRCLYLSGTQL